MMLLVISQMYYMMKPIINFKIKIMKKTIQLLMLLLIASSLFAQKPDKERISYQYVSLPKQPLPSEFQSYKLTISAEDLNFRDIIYSNTKIDGFKKLELESTVDPDINITVEMYPFEFKEPEKTSNTTTTKVDGVEKKTTTYGYKGAMRYKFKVSMTGRNDSIYLKKEYGLTVDISTSGHKDYTAAGKAYKSNAEEKKTSITKEVFSSEVTGDLNHLFGFPKNSVVIEVFSVKVGKKCKYDYSDLISCYDSFLKSYEIIKKNPDENTAFLNEMLPIIEKWKTALKESNISDKKSRINEDITCMIYNNIGVTYFISKDYDQAKEYFNKGIEIDKRWGNLDYFCKVSDKLKSMVENYNLQRMIVK